MNPLRLLCFIAANLALSKAGKTSFYSQNSIFFCFDTNQQTMSKYMYKRFGMNLNEILTFLHVFTNVYCLRMSYVSLSCSYNYYKTD